MRERTEVQTSTNSSKTKTGLQVHLTFTSRLSQAQALVKSYYIHKGNLCMLVDIPGLTPPKHG